MLAESTKHKHRIQSPPRNRVPNYELAADSCHLTKLKVVVEELIFAFCIITNPTNYLVLEV